jgi:hypothetical protein
MNDAVEYPLVSAIMLAGRMSQFDIFAAIQCFKSQTYPHKELIVLNNAKNQFAASELNLQAEKDIFLIDTPANLNAGMARNYGIKAANGRILAQFDADYWHDPKRLEAQIATLAENESHICVLSETLLYSYVSGRACLHTNSRAAVLGTMVFVRPTDIDYPPTTKHEEYGILSRMIKAGMKPISMAKPELCCKLLFTSGEEIDKPKNIGLNRKRFQIIKQIVKNRFALKHGEVLSPENRKNVGRRTPKPTSDPNK